MFPNPKEWPLCYDKSLPGAALFGSYSSATNANVYLFVDYCVQALLDKISPGAKCKTRAEADAIMGGLTFIAGLKTGYFDTAVFGQSPIV